MFNIKLICQCPMIHDDVRINELLNAIMATDGRLPWPTIKSAIGRISHDAAATRLSPFDRGGTEARSS